MNMIDKFYYRLDYIGNHLSRSCEGERLMYPRLLINAQL